jgi:hypothetical protein
MVVLFGKEPSQRPNNAITSDYVVVQNRCNGKILMSHRLMVKPLYRCDGVEL